MADAVFYDGESARRRTVSLKITASAVDIHEGSEWIASWPVGEFRKKDERTSRKDAQSPSGAMTGAMAVCLRYIPAIPCGICIGRWIVFLTDSMEGP